MTDQLLPYYNRELAFLRRLGAEFAEAHPKIAGRLQLGPDSAEDPHVERLLEGFAYLSARIRHKLDDDFPEITDALLGVLYPHYQAPIPSMAVIQCVLDRGQAQLSTGYTIPSGAALETDPVDGEPCRFRTVYPVTVWPIEVASAELHGRPFAVPPTPSSSAAVAALRLELRCLSPEMTFDKLEVDRLRFFLKGQAQHVFGLYELIFNSTIAVVLADSAKDPNPVLLDSRCLVPVGFERDEGMLPYSVRSMAGYRLLSEYFTFPQKFLFFDLTGLKRARGKKLGNTLCVFLLLSRSSVDLERNVSRDTLQLGCTPVVNLYRQRAEPVTLAHTRSEYRIVPDARRSHATEVYSVDQVSLTTPGGEKTDFEPFYSFKHASARQGQKRFWYATRRPASRTAGEQGRGTDVYLTLVDLGMDTSAPADGTLDIQTTCLNRDLPHRLPFGEGQLRLRLTAGGPLERIECLTRPTPTYRPVLRRGAMWRLISHLSLNHVSLVDSEEGADALREILKLYDFADSAETRSMIDGVLSVSSRRVVGRAGRDVQGGFCRGVEVTVHFDEQRFAGSGVFLFASVLERFFGLYCSLNSFSRLVATTNKREGALRRWSPRAGETVLL